MSPSRIPYVGRLAPSPTGLLHAGHARTFWAAYQRARATDGTLWLRNDDLDAARCRPEFVAAMREDLAWLGIQWREPMISQSERIPLYRAALARLHAGGSIFPCHRSRRDVLAAASAPHEGDETDEPVYPLAFRPSSTDPLPPLSDPINCNWRFRVPTDEHMMFVDSNLGPQHAVVGVDFGDFLVWRKDDLPSYQLASVVDDGELGVTEIVRGADLVRSTFRQLLLFRALGLTVPDFFHCALVTDDQGKRLAKRHDALAIRTLREAGQAPAAVRGDA